VLPSGWEAAGLLALMLFHQSRHDARVDVEGVLVVLEEQDRATWDHTLIARATAILDAEISRRCAGPYQLQAAIAALHAHAPSAKDNDWLQICALFERTRTPDDHHLLHAAKADLLRRSGRLAAARLHYVKATELAINLSERRYLERRIAEL
jgi:RNA polymerase sigma-70 factor (ECF subfamily)